MHACRGEAASKGIHEELGQTLAELMPLVNMAFFSLAGASLILVGATSTSASNPQAALTLLIGFRVAPEAPLAVGFKLFLHAHVAWHRWRVIVQGRVISTLWVALLVWAARMAAIYGGSWMGAALGGTPTEYRLRVWQGMITQVGTLFFDQSCIPVPSSLEALRVNCSPTTSA